ncbi:MAG TPA: efflux RND transporter periplasmic adaptor subunit [Planctomycetota bacterium]|nr:efflux RND transporter periplasmic adaptor subunit [Planctomycetota bacterium]
MTPHASSRSAGLRTVLLLAACAVVGACSDSAAPPDEPQADEHAEPLAAEAPAEDGVLEIEPAMRRDLRLTTAPVERRADVVGSLALGELRASEAGVAEIASPVEARVLRLLAAPGDVVTAGQPLVDLQSVELGRAWAEYLAADARLGLARTTEERERALSTGGVSARKELEAAQAETTAAAAMLRAARAALESLGVPDPEAGAGAEAAAGRFSLAAPLDGTVLARDAVVGRFVHPGETLFRQADLATLWLVVHAAERDALRVRLGATADVLLPALPGVALTGRVAWIGAEVDAGTRTVPVRVELANPDGRLRPGLSGSAALPLEGAGEMLVVPAAAVQRHEDGWCVFQPAGEGRFTCRPIGRGRELGGQVEILSGVSEGETVVVDGAFLLRAELERRVGGGSAHEH